MGTRHLARLFTLFVVQLVVADPRGVFGDWGVIMAVSLALTTLRQLGFGQALVNRSEWGDTELERAASTAFWIVFCSTALLIGLGVLGADWMISSFGGRPELVLILQILICSALLDPFGAVAGSLLQRRLNFDSIARCEVLSSYTFMVVTVCSALAGAGLWALVLGHVFSNLSQIVAVMLSAAWFPRLLFDRGLARSMFSFGGWLWLNAVLQIVHQTADRLILYKLFGKSLAGDYNYARTLTVAPSIPLSNGLHRVLFPILSQVKSDREKLNRVYVRGISLVSFVIVPATAGFWWVAPDLVDVVASQMGNVTDLFRVLALLAATIIAGALTRPLLFALGHTRAWALIGASRQVLILALIGMLVFAFDRGLSLEGMAWAYTAPTFLSLTVVHGMAMKILNVPLSSLVRALATPAASTAIMLGCLTVVEEVIEIPTSGAISLLISVLVGVATYMLAALLLDRSHVRQILTELQRVVGARASATSASS